jgi:lipid A ethanolaminephosphotransferase
MAAVLPARESLAAPPPSRRWTMTASVDQVLLAVSVFWALACNRPFLAAALDGQRWSDPAAIGFAAALVIGLVALHLLLLAPVANRYTVKPVVALVLVATAFAVHYMERFGVYLDPSMLRNVLRTDVREARELFTASLVPSLLLYAGLPLLLLWRVHIVRAPLRRALLVRAVVIAAAAAVLAGAIVAAFQPLSSLVRNHKEVRYLVTPGNYLWSAGVVLAGDTRGAAVARKPIGTDAVPGARFAARTRPTLLVVVVGETARAANWGLSGYARQTTPRLAKLPVINFAQVDACGTDTEVSLPCMFAPVGRRDYDERAIRGSQSLLHVAARAGVDVRWRDNQSGCKGVCEGLPNETLAALDPPGLCEGGRCRDEGLLLDLPERLARARGTQLLVLHMLGNHGPSYFRRYPPAFEKFTPACRNDDLRRCSVAEIVNAYDNALLYTDHVLAALIETLAARTAAVNSAVIYVSDHGESLGEGNLFLHGLPYAIAPQVQARVPMVMWLSDGFARAEALDRDCLARRAAQPAAHDHLFHTVLGLLDVRTSVYAPQWDLAAGCRRPPAADAAH